MTDTKLPESVEYALKMLVNYATLSGLAITSEKAGEFSLTIREALRQSQSLPAGAVAGLVGKWRDNADALRSNQPVSDWQRAEELENAADELEQALQADAREKGEAVSDWERNARQHLDVIRFHLRRGDHIGLYGRRCTDEILDVIGVLLATQPAQASEKESQRYTEDDGCPTELAVLQRFWRANQPVTSSQETASE